MVTKIIMGKTIRRDNENRKDFLREKSFDPAWIKQIKRSQEIRKEKENDKQSFLLKKHD